MSKKKKQPGKKAEKKFREPVKEKSVAQKKPPFLNPLPTHPMNIAIVALVLAATVFFIYSRILDAPFVYDDFHNIPGNVSIHAKTPGELFHFLVHDPARRKLSFFSFALNYYLGGPDPFGYHLLNILIHIVNGCLIFILAGLTISLFESGGDQIPENHETGSWRLSAAFFTSLIWTVHPVQLQAVTYITQRFVSLSAMFYLSSLVLYILGRQRNSRISYIYYTISAVLAILGVNAKETTLVLPIIIVLYELVFFQTNPLESFKKRKWLYIGLPLLFIISALLIIEPKHVVWIIVKGYDRYEFSMLQRIFTEFRVIVYYVTLLIYPHPSRLQLVYEAFPISISLFNPITTAFSAVVILGAAAYSLYSLKKRQMPALLILWFLGNLFLESSFVALDLVNIYRIYLPSFGLILWAVIAVYRIFGSSRFKPAVIFILIATALSVGTYSRNETWTSPIRLWTDNVAKSPSSVESRGNLAKTLRDAGRYDEAVKEFEKILELGIHDRYDLFDTYQNLGAIYLHRKEYEKAKVCLETVLEDEPGLNIEKTDPDLLLTYNNLAQIYINHFGRIDEAETLLKEAIKRNPKYTDAYVNLGAAYLKQGKTNPEKLHEAEKVLTQALSLDPKNRTANFNLAATYINLRRYTDALVIIERGIEYWPDSSRFYRLKGIALQQIGNTVSARKAFEKARLLNPGNRANENISRHTRI